MSDLPSVLISVRGDVGECLSPPNAWPFWRIYAEADRDDSIYVQVSLNAELIAKVRVYQTSEGIGLWDEAQDIAGALLWSAIRAFRRDQEQWHPDACYSLDPKAFRDCSGDGHYLCVRCARFNGLSGVALLGAK